MTVETYEQAAVAARAEKRVVVELERRGSRAIVRLNDPERLNPLSGELTVQLHDTLRELATDHEVRTVVLTGAEPAFSAGGDLQLMREVAHPMVDEGPDGATALWEVDQGRVRRRRPPDHPHRQDVHRRRQWGGRRRRALLRARL
jgi:2-(1,2-epoxy-1,2-dihydrophenyl)acetyl-CoA isomerase